MNPIRIACLALLASTCTSTVQAQSEALRSTTSARERTRIEAQEIYAEGAYRLAPRWRGVRMLDDAAVFIRQEVPKVDKGQVSVWLGRELVTPRYYEKEKPYLSMRERFVADCRTRRLGLSEWAYYSGQFGEGQVVTRDKTGQPELNSTLPDSLEEQVVGIACSPKQRKTPVAKAKKHQSLPPPPLKPKKKSPCPKRDTGKVLLQGEVMSSL